MSKDKEQKKTPLWMIPVKHPAIFVALLTTFTAAGSWGIDLYKANSRGVAVEDLGRSEKVMQAWHKNFDCTKKIDKHQAIELAQNSELPVRALTVTACPSGDIFVQLINPQGLPKPVWILSDDYIKNQASTLPLKFSGAAIAQTIPVKIENVPTILCQWIDGAVIVRVLQYQAGNCILQKINSYSGQVISSEPTECFVCD